MFSRLATLHFRTEAKAIVEIIRTGQSGAPAPSSRRPLVNIFTDLSGLGECSQIGVNAAPISMTKPASACAMAEPVKASTAASLKRMLFGARTIRAELIARRAVADAALIDRFHRAKAEGNLPDAIDPQALANYLGAVVQGPFVQNGSGCALPGDEPRVEAALAIWPGS